MHRYAVLIAWITLVAPLWSAEVGVRNPSEFAAVVNHASPGDSIVLADGTWQDAELVFEANGAAERPITLRAQTPGKTVFRGNSRILIAGNHLIVSGMKFQEAFHSDALVQFRRDSKRLAYDCRVTECAIVDCNPTSTKSASHWVSLYGERNRIDHCWLEGKTNVGTTLVVWLPEQGGRPNAHRIDHNYFGPRPVLKKNGGETIRVGDSKTSMQVSGTVVEQNWFDQCDGEVEIVSNKSCRNEYRANVFSQCSGALTLRHGDNCRVEDNFFLGAKARGTGGVRIIGRGHIVANNYFAGLEGDDTRAAISIMNGIPNSPLNGYAAVVGASVVGNVLVNCKQSFVIGLGDKDADTRVPPRDVTISGNVVVARRGPIVDMRERSAAVVWSSNVAAGAEIGIDVPENQWQKTDLALGMRNGLECPEVSKPCGPRKAPLDRREAGPSWYTKSER
jgi:poly(beta-D-mannuronate) lyase